MFRTSSKTEDGLKLFVVFKVPDLPSLRKVAKELLQQKEAAKKASPEVFNSIVKHRRLSRQHFYFLGHGLLASSI